MNIQGLAGVAQAFGAYGAVPAARQGVAFTAAQSAMAQQGTQLHISDAAKALAAQDETVAARLKGIQSTPAAQRSDQDVAFLQRNDPHLAEVLGKNPQARTADDVDYLQKAGGFVNTMAKLSPQEKQLYDELVAKGDTEAVRGMNLIAMSRMGSGEVRLPDGKTFDPEQTAISADHIRQLFSQMFVSADGQDAKSLDALAKFLDSKRSSAA